jgi:hypothetical protein
MTMGTEEVHRLVQDGVQISSVRVRYEIDEEYIPPG